MSCVSVFPFDEAPIKDVNDLIVQRAARFVVEEINRRGKHHLIYKRVVNGLFYDLSGRCIVYILVIEAINEHCIPWSYIARVEHFLRDDKFTFLSFKEVIEFPAPK